LLLNRYGGIYKWDLTINQGKADIKTTLIVNLEKCIKLFALSARKLVKCLSNLHPVKTFSAKNVTQRKVRKDIN
jgi:hypothetical protein